MSEKIGIVDAGGGMRGIYAAGLMDYCMDMGVTFDLGIGVSAGSANLASFISNQPRRNLTFYTEYAFRKEYMSFRCLLHTKSFIDMDYVYGTLSNANGENPIDYNYLAKNPMDFLVVATNAETGEPRYFGKQDLWQDHFDPLKASSSIPFVCQPYVIDGVPYFDGALSDPIPVKKAFEWGCDKVVVVVTLPEDTVRSPSRDLKIAGRIEKTYPNSAYAMSQRAHRYNESMDYAKKLAKEGKVLIAAPDDTCGVSTLKRSDEALRALYTKGYEDGYKIEAFVKHH